MECPLPSVFAVLPVEKKDIGNYNKDGDNPRYTINRNLYVVKNGIVQTDYTGTYEYNGRQYDVVNGRVTNDN